MLSRAAFAARRVGAAHTATACRSMSSTANVWVDKNTKVLCQGFTGKQVRVGLGGVRVAVQCSAVGCHRSGRVTWFCVM